MRYLERVLGYADSSNSLMPPGIEHAVCRATTDRPEFRGLAIIMASGAQETSLQHEDTPFDVVFHLSINFKSFEPTDAQI